MTLPLSSRRAVARRNSRQDVRAGAGPLGRDRAGVIVQPMPPTLLRCTILYERRGLSHGRWMRWGGTARGHRLRARHEGARVVEHAGRAILLGGASKGAGISTIAGI